MEAMASVRGLYPTVVGEPIREIFGTMVDVEVKAFCTPLMGIEESVFVIKEFG